MTPEKFKTTDQSVIKGRIDGVVGQGISGWALRPSDLEQRLWIELMVDGVSLGVGRAEHFHPDAGPYGDGCYGFWIPIPPVVLTMAQAVEVFVANTGETFDRPWELEKTASGTSELSQVMTDGGLRLSGWAVDPDNYRKSLRISAILNNRILVSVQADQRRFQPDNTDGHGFTLTLPLDLADGNPHEITIQDEKNRNLNGSPVRIQTFPELTSDWLHNVQITGTNKALLKIILQNYENILPKSLGFGHYREWKENFPPNAPALKLKGVAVCPAEAPASEIGRLAASNEGVLLMCEGTNLLPQALVRMAAAHREKQAALVYGDSEIEKEETIRPLFKPAWDPFLFCGYDYLGPVLIDSRIIRDLDIRPGESHVSLRTRLILAAAEHRVAHLPFPVSLCKTEIPVDPVERREVLRDSAFLRTTSAQITAHPQFTYLNRLSFPLKRRPRVSIIIPTRDRADLLGDCLGSLGQKTAYEAMEILIVDNGSTEEKTFELFRRAEQQGARILPYPHAFNYAAMNNRAAVEARGEVLCFLNNDTRVRSREWLLEMLSLLLLPKVGCVGAKLIWPNELVQHGGVVVGTHQLAAHVGNAWTTDAPGYMYRNQLTQQWSAVTAACLLTWKSIFLDNGGFDPVHYPVAFNDVDYCLRIRELGHQILWTPWAELDHLESASRGKDLTPIQKARSDMEYHHFRTRWGHYDDPFYNPNLTLSAVVEPFDGLALPPRKRKTRL
ncbi:glycosyltransferase family 2 protein [Desulfobacter postgatei]|uniref:Putative glycosyltransferase n=1 Tax=Desulfobacter postgatei 2ac9 TaxID=879212 RepID=I5B5V1_9BACT|nr:glycosyltransferase [Desulfobacter postgatei]EIM64864.1 putative glycosyltransferase [Desulfobacter postgatei 2ac9]